ncbi:MAG TPA: ABC transporter substrate-binding protein, partial [Stellaceae bacterium]|nr:ABC transporter substrate-binding protein [Stellaceae bacterium]
MKAAFAASIALLSLPFAAHAADKITIATVGSSSAMNWPLLVGIEKGIFVKDGVSLDLYAAQSSAAVQQQAAAGSVDMATGGLIDPLRAIDQGAPITVVRIEAKYPPYGLYAQKNIHSYADLKGKTLMVGGAKDVTRIYLQRMMAPNGLKPGDYDLIYAGATSARFASLQSGAVAASLLSAPFNFKAQSLGFTDLGTTIDYVKDFPFTAYSANIAWAKAHKSALQGFLKGYADSVAWFNDPAHKQEAVDILVKRTGAQPDDAAKTYDFFIKY